MATVGYCCCLDGYQASAFLVDVKMAIRFLWVHTKENSIDPERVAIWGSRYNIEKALVDAVILKSMKTAKEQLDTCPDEREDLKQSISSTTTSSANTRRR